MWSCWWVCFKDIYWEVCFCLHFYTGAEINRHCGKCAVLTGSPGTIALNDPSQLSAREDKKHPKPPTSFPRLPTVPLTQFVKQPFLVVCFFYSLFFCVLCLWHEAVLTVKLASVKLCWSQYPKTSGFIHYLLHDLHLTINRPLTSLWAVFPVGLKGEVAVHVFILNFKWPNVFSLNDVTCQVLIYL